MMNPSTKDLPDSGTIKLSDVKAEFSKGNNLLDYLGEGGVTSSAPLNLTDFYGTSAGPPALISLPSDSPHYSEWRGSGSGAMGLDMGSWNFGARAAQGNNCIATTLSSKTLGNGNSFVCTYDLTFETVDGGYVALAYKGYANTLLSGHNTAQTKDCSEFSVNPPPRLATQAGRFSGSVTFGTDYAPPHQLGLMVVAYGATGSWQDSRVTVHSLVITDTSRKKTALRKKLGKLAKDHYFVGTQEISE